MEGRKYTLVWQKLTQSYSDSFDHMKFDAKPLKFTKYTTECALGLILERVHQFPAVWGETSLVGSSGSVYRGGIWIGSSRSLKDEGRLELNFHPSSSSSSCQSLNPSCSIILQISSVSSSRADHIENVQWPGFEHLGKWRFSWFLKELLFLSSSQIVFSKLWTTRGCLFPEHCL